MDIAYRNAIIAFLKQSSNTEVNILSSQSLYGGSINQVHLLELETGNKSNSANSDSTPTIPSRIVVKVNTQRPAGFFAKEMDGLQSLNQAVKKYGIEISIPNPLGVFTVSQPHSAQFLMMEYLPPASNDKGKIGSKSWREFGCHLARLHQETSTERGKTTDNSDNTDKYGYHKNTFIGNNVQNNTLENNWVVFFKKHRLIPQAEWGSQNHLLSTSTQKKLDRVITDLEKYLPDHPPPALLHGDLWTGNAFFSESGKPVIFDPAVYYGHGETDLAMTELFGSFPPEFYDGYHEIFPKDSETELRKVIYNLYHLLNHLNLFGTSYLSSVEASLNHILRH